MKIIYIGLVTFLLIITSIFVINDENKTITIENQRLIPKLYDEISSVDNFVLKNSHGVFNFILKNKKWFIDDTLASQKKVNALLYITSDLNIIEKKTKNKKQFGYLGFASNLEFHPLSLDINTKANNYKIYFGKQNKNQFNSTAYVLYDGKVVLTNCSFYEALGEDFEYWKYVPPKDDGQKR